MTTARQVASWVRGLGAPRAAAVAGMVLSLGCGSSTTDAVELPAGTDGGGGSGASSGGGGSGASSGGGGSGASSGSGGTSTGGSSGSGGSGGTSTGGSGGGNPDPCAGVTCSGHGTCKAISGFGVCFCDMDPGHPERGYYFPAGPNGCVSTRPGHALPVGGDSWTIARSIAKTSDGGYIVLVDGGPGFDFFSLVKLSSTLSIEWTKQFDCGKSDSAYNAQQTPDGGYIILSRHFDLLTMWVIKTDSAGGKLWEKDFSNSDLGITEVQGIDPKWIEVAADGGLIAAVSPRTLVKLSNAGDLQWSNRTSGWITQVKNVPGGGYMLAHMGFGLIKTDGQGTELFSKTYLNSQATESSLAMTPDGGYVVAGYSTDPSLHTNVHFAKADAAGTLLWERDLGAVNIGYGADIAHTVDVTPTGDIYVGGSLYSGGSGFFLAKVDSIGTPIWLFTYASNYLEDAYNNLSGSSCDSVVATPSGGAICVGRVGLTNGGWLLEVDANGVPLP